MSVPAQEALLRIDAEVRSNLSAPQRDAVAFLGDVLQRLKKIPLSVEPRVRIDCLLSAAQQFYHQGQSVFSAVEPVAVAVMLSRDLNDHALLRRALTFQGIILSNTGNPADALRSHVEALEIAETLGDDTAIAVVWTNLGAALYHAALYVDSIESSRRAAELSVGHEAARSIRANSLTNIALCLLHTHQYQQGLSVMRDSISLMTDDASAAALRARVLAEGTYVRLLLATGNIDQAAERSRIAREHAANARSIAADVSAACSEALVEVYQGQTDNGLSRGVAALEKARAIKPSLRETLLALVDAYEHAGKHDKALALHRELTLHIRKAQQENILRHHELHLERLQMHEGNQYPEELLDERDAELKRKLADEVAGMRQGDMLEQFAFAAELRDDTSGEHCYRVARLASLLAKEHGEDDAFCAQLELAARLHDIGKAAIPDVLLQKQKPLTQGERAIIQTHAATGADLLSRTGLDYSTMAEDMARHHHERWDGEGYPDGISGTAIPLTARMVTLADAFDAMTHAKPYRRAWAPDEALGEIQRQKGLQFDPRLTEMFVPLVQRLMATHPSLDAFLGEAAREAAIKKVRARISQALAAPAIKGPQSRRHDLA
jgi:putative two-component system response regulator